jgi:hypothetical protein
VHVTAPEWTEGRLDDLSDKVDRRFERVDERLDRIDEKIARGFERADERFDREFGRVNDRLDSIQRAMIQAMIAVTGGILTGFTGIIALIATQL